MQSTADSLGTPILPTSFAQARARHGRHFARYQFAAQFARDKHVLDIACGGGVGSAWLANIAESVVGMDLDQRMLSWGRQHFSAANLQFRSHDLHQPIGETFELITCFETLEHVHEPEHCLNMLCDALDKEGVLLLSVPNGEMELSLAADKPYHLTQFTAPMLNDLLGSRFGSVQFFGQVYQKNMLHYLRKLAGGAHHADNYRFVPGLPSDAKTWLAVCRKVGSL